MKMNNYWSKSLCHGCTACKAVCPVNAINMIPDQEGFLYPVINESECIMCGRCESVCQINKKNDRLINKVMPQQCYAIKHIDGNVRQQSSSGGAFTLITDYLIDKLGAVCYGACFDENMYVQHKALYSKEHRNKARGSKYVQSDLKNTYKEINEILARGKFVLFSGTPCQVAGLQKYLNVVGANIDKLITLDIICTGTPSPMIWSSYINEIKEKYNSEVTAYSFRYKPVGWRYYPIMAELRDGKKVVNTLFLRTFINIFFSFNALRPSCYQCTFASGERVADITMGDFWQVDKTFPEYADNKGISLVLLNSSKGCELFNRIKNLAEIRQCDIDIAFKGQRNLNRCTEEPSSRKQFWQDYLRGGFAQIASKYGGYNFIGWIKQNLKIILTLLNLRK
ncbi:Coenzyme F420 hydrogenase/dehydrogenase, beta subunit C-terminal domain [Desulfoscipio sp. XC116]|uniref:Coenzyme F420 hydrogenase/dehydrogenase, beta subunit C-terminal domain n=1 Tax=Desulfoscipio sp. XC116 TaxID=3144975 RepID=UPI00325BFC49